MNDPTVGHGLDGRCYVFTASFAFDYEVVELGSGTVKHKRMVGEKKAKVHKHHNWCLLAEEEIKKWVVKSRRSLHARSRQRREISLETLINLLSWERLDGMRLVMPAEFPEIQS